MAMFKSPEYEMIVMALSSMIQTALGRLNAECLKPERGPDASDHFITNEQERVNRLKGIRNEFEEIANASSEIWPNVK
jgi:hypothetical protein